MGGVRDDDRTWHIKNWLRFPSVRITW
eukprot:COSAG01_NODE_65372_length_273_cov_1.057471_1_plen_26_part_01